MLTISTDRGEFKQLAEYDFWPTTNLRCLNCAYYSSDVHSCDYILREGTRRGCPVGEGCDKFVQVKKIVGARRNQIERLTARLKKAKRKRPMTVARHRSGVITEHSNFGITLPKNSTREEKLQMLYYGNWEPDDLPQPECVCGSTSYDKIIIGPKGDVIGCDYCCDIKEWDEYAAEVEESRREGEADRLYDEWKDEHRDG